MKHIKLLIISMCSIFVLVMIFVGSAEASGTVTTIDPSGASCAPAGDQSGVDYAETQSVLLASGIVSQVQVYVQADVGAPAGDLHYDIAGYNSQDPSIPGLSHQTGSISPTRSAWNTIDITSPWYESGSSVIWVTVWADTQDNDNRYCIAYKSGNLYANGARCYSTNGMVTWTCTTADLAVKVTTLDPTATPQATPYQVIVTLESGELFLSDPTVTYGDMALGLLLIVLIFVILFVFLMRRIHGRNDNGNN